MTGRARSAATWLALCGIAALASFLLEGSAALRFSAYALGLPPWAMMLLAGFAGAKAIRLSPKPQKQPDRQTALLVVLAAFSCGIIALAIDVISPLPQDINVRGPQALLFYPLIALFAETLFHLAPVAMIAAHVRDRPWLWACPAMIEPVFQFTLAHSSVPLAVNLAVALNVLLLNGAQILLLRLYGWQAMIGLRLAYYLLWHILWGHARLALLF